MRETVLSNIEGLRLASNSAERDAFQMVIMEQFDVLRSRAEAAERELAELKERTRWIPVSERLPEIGNRSLVLARKSVCEGKWDGTFMGILNPECEGWHTVDNFCLHTVTHWQPLPEPPDGE